MRVLSLDPAASTGYCIIDMDVAGNKANIIEYGFIDVDTSSDYQGDHSIDLMNRVKAIIDVNQIQHVTIEDYFFSSRFANGSNVNAAYRTALHILCCQHKIPYTILNISAWKSFVAGRSVPTKDQKKRWGAAAAKKLYIQQALWEKWNFRFPNHSLSEKTKKPIIFRFDIVDVVGQAVYFAGLLNGVKNISMNVPIPPDVTFKSKNKKQFIYPV
jgi:Holliday junction resolvasome RuvABC endonuclease subunit